MRTKILTLIVMLSCGIAHAQQDTIQKQDTLTYRILKTDGGELIGKILSQDSRELLLLTSDNREVYIPQHVIKEIKVLDINQFTGKGDSGGGHAVAFQYASS